MTANLQLGELVGRGLQAEVYALDEQRVAKIFQDWVPARKVDWEFRVTRALHKIGVPCPEAFEVIDFDGRNGIVFERLRGISMLRKFQSRPWWVIGGSRLLAELHAQLHSFEAPDDLPTQREQIEGWLAAARDLSEQDRLGVAKFLECLPEGSAVCHADFHPENVLFTTRGPMIIDWSTGTRGHAIGDVARTASLFLNGELPAETPIFIKLIINSARRFARHVYLKRYFQLRPGSLRDLDFWAPIQKAATSAWRARHENFPSIKASSTP